jgi:3-isopropylmalate/(R)-2-methylmalate dehydratase small subunit
VSRIVRGKVWKFGDGLDSGNIEGVMAGVDPEFHKKVRPGDIIVAGLNFGMGSSSEQAPRSLKDAGVAAIVAESISNIYLRTLVNIGLPAIECEGAAEAIQEGDEIEIDLLAGEIRNLTSGDKKNFAPFSQYAIGILDNGGLIPFLRESLARRSSRAGRLEER